MHLPWVSALRPVFVCMQNVSKLQFAPCTPCRLGNYLCTKANATLTKLVYKGFCHVHSRLMRERDETKDPTKVKLHPLKFGRSSSFRHSCFS